MAPRITVHAEFLDGIVHPDGVTASCCGGWAAEHTTIPKAVTALAEHLATEHDLHPLSVVIEDVALCRGCGGLGAAAPPGVFGCCTTGFRTVERTVPVAAASVERRRP